MDYLEGGGDFSVESARYVVEHSGTMEDGPVPIFAWYWLLFEIGAIHLDESAPGLFDKNVGDLFFSKGCNYLGFIAVDPSGALSPHKFLVKLCVEAAGESDDVRAELGESVDDLV